ncbi:AI-2E family transporter [Shimazuella kribbensis]|uniref:AI-2E family transporter n=1 Tax=Shimazuella kribbensis TaxID=139808 RepID=UPI000412F272|nr:AI-2E family transporter [Shimazuella kribbensis]
MEKLLQSRFFQLSVFLFVILGSIYLLIQLGSLFHHIGYFLRAVCVPFFLAVFIAYLLNPVVNLLARRKVPRFMAILLIYAVFLVSVTVLFMNLFPILQEQVSQLVTHIPEWNQRFNEFWHTYHDHSEDVLPHNMHIKLEQMVAGVEQKVSNWITGLMGSLGSLLNQIFLLLIIPFLSFYMLKDIDRIEKFFLTMLPKQRRGEIARLFRSIDLVLGNYIRGQFIVCIIIGILAFIGYKIIGLPYAFLFAFFVALFNVIPYVGPFFGAIPAILLACTVSFKLVLGTIVVNMVVQILEGNVISPQIVGRSLHLHPLAIIFALLVGEEIGGVWGLLLAVPTLAVGKVIFEFLVSSYLRHKPN